MAGAPRAYLDENPTHQSIRLGGRFINAKRMALDLNIERTHLTRIFAGERTPSLDLLRRIARAFGMTMEDLLECIEERRQYLLKKTEGRRGQKFIGVRQSNL